jgi:hypothetical protein
MTPLSAPGARRPLASLAASRTPAMSSGSAPAPAAPAPVAVLTDAPLDTGAETQSRWRAALESINQRKRLLGAFLEESAFMGCGGGRLVLGMDDLHRAVVEEKDNRAIVADELTRVFGEVLQLQCVPLAAAGAEPGRPTAEQTEAMVARALAWLGTEAPAATAQERTEE